MRSAFHIPNSYYSERSSYINENEEGYFIELDMPGVSKDGLKISLEGANLYIEGNRANRAPVKRAFLLPEDVEADKIAAQLRDGVLELALPKKEKAKPKLIPVKEGTESLLPKNKESCCD